MDWLKKLVQAGQRAVQGQLRNPDGVDKEMLDAIGQYLGGVREVDPELAFALVRYVVDDDVADVLAKLSSHQEACKQLGYTRVWVYNSPSLNRLAEVLKGERRAPAAVWIRLAHVLEAASRANTQIRTTIPAGWPPWLRVLIAETVTMKLNFNHAQHNFRPRPIGDIEQILAAEELSPDILVNTFLDLDLQQAFSSGSNWYYGNRAAEAFSGLDAYFKEHLATVRSFFAGARAEQRVFALSVLNLVKFDFGCVFDILIELGTGSSKTARDAVFPYLNECKATVRPALEKILSDGAASERHEAVVLLSRLFGSECVELLKQHAQLEKADRVKQTIEKLTAVPECARTDGGPQFQIPKLEIELGRVPLSETAKAKLEDSFKKGFDNCVRAYEQQLKQYEAPNRPRWVVKPVKPALNISELCKRIFAFIEGETKDFEFSTNVRLQVLVQQNETREWVGLPEIRLIHVVRLCYALKILIPNQGGTIWLHDRGAIEAHRSRCQTPYGLRELDHCVATLPNCKPGIIARTYLRNAKWYSFFDWCPPEGVWPLFGEYPEIIREALNPKTSDYWESTLRQNAFEVLSMYPEVPAEFISLVWDLALGEGKTDRKPAQKVLASLPGKAERIVVALGDGKQTVRAAAAEWLGQIGDKSAIVPLKKAFEKEKHEVAKGAIMHALDALGADVDEFLNRDALLKEAQAGLAKKRPKGMDWVPLTNLPELHWTDTGKRVEPAIVEWWVVQGIQQKLAAPGPILKRYLSMCRPQETARLANYLLASWVGHDTRTLSQEEAAAKAQAETDKHWANYSGHQYWLDHYKGDKNNLYKEYYQRFSTECIGTAIDEKGLLAMVAAAGDGDSVKICQKYIRTWFGNKLSQCKALIDVLAWIDHPLALQALLSFANRFRTKAIKQLAEDHVARIAELRGWTIDELADRTIADAGFARPVDEDGEPIGDAAVLDLDFGPRQFQVKLNDDLEPVIYSKADGKTLKSLPAPGKSDDEEKAKEAKKLLSDAKKTVKEVVKGQSERLYEALCTQRSWKFADWQRYLAQHPIVGRLCVRVTWAAFAPPSGEQERGEFIGCFRPLEDGSLTNEKDEEVNLPDNALVFIAHTCNVSNGLEQAWLKHLEDYDVTPLFQQFGRATYALPAELAKATEITDFEGHCLTTFKLRGKAAKLGYLRGDAEDGGAFFIYRKPFSSLSLQAVVAFTGSYLPEEDIPAALTNLYFSKMQENTSATYWDPDKLPLHKVPAVLLSECYNDVKQIAAEGSGYDPKWREKGL